MTWIHDGDTVTVTHSDGSETDVRLRGLNAPEEGECFYEEALQRAVRALRDREVRLTHTGKDQFGRTLAHVWIGSRHINVDLVADGYAIANTPEEGDPHGDELVEAERGAAEQGRGLWGTELCGGSGPPPDVRIEVVEANPPGPDDQALGEETVVITNRSGGELDVSDWIIRDESSRHRYRFPDGTIVSRGEVVMVSSSDAGWDPGRTPVWNNDGDLAMLLDDRGRVVSATRY